MRPRDYRIDILRIVSAFFIVVIHVVSTSVTYNDVAVDAHTARGLNVVHNLSSWAVPVFFMITGFCVLGDDRECTWRWTFVHIWKYAGILFTVGWFYAFLEYIYLERSVSLRAAGASFVDVLNGKTWTHMWFIYSIIGIYLVLPVIKPCIVASEKNVYCLAGVLFFTTVLLPVVNDLLKLSIDIKLPIAGYIFYVIAGAAAARCHFQSMKYVNLVFMAVDLLVIVYFLCCGREEIYAYTSLPVCLMAIGIFIPVAKNDAALHGCGGRLEKLAKCTLGIYLIHPLFLNLMVRLLHIYPLHITGWISIPVTCIALFLVSYGTVCLLRKIPGVKMLF